MFESRSERAAGTRMRRPHQTLGWSGEGTADEAPSCVSENRKGFQNNPARGSSAPSLPTFHMCTYFCALVCHQVCPQTLLTGAVQIRRSGKNLRPAWRLLLRTDGSPGFEPPEPTAVSRQLVAFSATREPPSRGPAACRAVRPGLQSCSLAPT